MKKLLTLFCLFVLSAPANAQAPQAINYQAVARNATGQPLVNQSIGLQLSVLDGSAIGAALYVERFNLTTNILGLFTLQIGTGTAQSGNFATINWGAANRFLKVELDPTGGTSYTLSGTSQFVSVPYALSAQKATGMALSDLTNVSATAPATNDVLTWNGTAWTPSAISGNSGWGLSGNSGTTASNFIGTTDNQPLRFGVNSQNAGMINPASNSVALGQLALDNNTTGSYNIAVGTQALNGNLTGSTNVAVGASAAAQNTGGSHNVAIGGSALFQNTTGNYNTALGRSALSQNTTGGYNTAVGANAGPNTGSGALTNTTALGANARVDASNSMVLGSVVNINGATANTKVGIGTTTPQQALHVRGKVQVDTLNSGAATDSVVTVDANGVLRKRNAAAFARNSGWELSGNNGTDSNNFIGTTDTQSLRFRVNNQKAGFVAPAIVGGNVALGAQSLENNPAWGNVAIGLQALQISKNMNNTAVGVQTLMNNVTGSENVAIGAYAAPTTEGNSNTAIGFYALDGNTTGSSNIAVGRRALTSNVSGNANTALGARADVGDTALNNATAIGSNARVDASNSMVLGSIVGVNSATANTKVGIGTTTPQQALHVKGKVQVDSLNSGAATDSVVTVANGVLGKRATTAPAPNYWTQTGNNIRNNNSGLVSVNTAPIAGYRLSVKDSGARTGDGGSMLVQYGDTATAYVSLALPKSALAGSSRLNAGVMGKSDSSDGVRGYSKAGAGIYGWSKYGVGGNFYSFNSHAVYGYTDNPAVPAAWFLGGSGGSGLGLQVSGSSYLNGNTGIGNVTFPLAQALEVGGGIKVGTVADAAGTAGTIRYNSTLSKFQGYDGTAWQDLNGGSSGTSAWTQSGNQLYPTNIASAVGIGTTVPTFDLDIRKNNDATILVRTAGTTNKGQILIGSITNGTGITTYAGSATNTFAGKVMADRGLISQTFKDLVIHTQDSLLLGTNNTLHVALSPTGNLGIGTRNPNARLEVAGAVLSQGTSGGTPVSGSGTRMMWVPAKAAFRAGTVSGTQWDNANIGQTSAAFGNNNTASGASSFVTGENNSVTASYSAIVGDNNTVAQSQSFVSGHANIISNATGLGGSSAAFGLSNNVSGFTNFAAGNSHTISNSYGVALGNTNTVSGYTAIALGDHCAASGNTSVALGNQSTASGQTSLVAGFLCTASGAHSVALGSHAGTNGMTGAFVLGDYPDPANPFSTPTASLDNQLTARFLNGYRFYTDVFLSTGVQVTPGGSSWSFLSDSTKKTNFRKVDGEYLLGSIAKMKAGTWNYKTQDAAHFRHYGPMAQEFFRYFGKDALGTIGCDTLIASQDMEGVLFLAVQALEKRTAELQQATATIDALQKSQASIEERLSKMEAALQKERNGVEIADRK